MTASGVAATRSVQMLLDREVLSMTKRAEIMEVLRPDNPAEA